MSRIIYSEDFVSQRLLLKNIIIKDTADGVGSVIRPLLIQKGIVLADDATAGADADVQEALRLSLSKQSENLSEVRDLKIEKAFGHVRGGSQFLKSFYKPNVQELGTWSVTVNGNRVVMPTKFPDKVTLFEGFKSRHDTLTAGTGSPLAPYLTQQGIDLLADALAKDQAQAAHLQFKDAERDSETATETRDLVWNPVIGHYKEIGGYLMNLFSNNTKKLGDWGFTVDDSPRAPKVRITNLKIVETKTIVGITIGGTLKNLAGVIHVYKGKTTSGTPIIVPAGEMLGMTKGFSIITVVNPSTLDPGKFSVLRNA